MLRANIAADRDANLEPPLSNPLVAKKSPYPVVGLYVVSRGSLTNSLVSFVAGTADDPGSFTIGEAFGTSPTWGSFYDSLGLFEGDIYTFVFFAYGNTQALVGGNYVAEFGFVRLTVKDLSDEQRLLTTAPSISDFFEIRTSGNVSGQTLAFGSNQPSAITMYSGRILQSVACIRSREDSGLRSSEQMVYMYGDDIAGSDGVCWSNVVAVWSEGTQLGESELILEGGGFTTGAE